MPAFITGLKPLSFLRVHHEPKTLVKPGNHFPEYERKELDNCQVGENYPITLIQRVVHIDQELKRAGIPRVDTANRLTFAPGELERRLSSAKKEFLAKLKTSGLTPEETKVYYRLVSFNPYF